MSSSTAIEYLKQLDIGYFFYSDSYVDDILKVLDPAEKTIIHIPNVNSRESTKDKIKEVEHIIEALGDWQGTDPATGFQLIKTSDGRDSARLPTLSMMTRPSATAFPLR